MNEPKPNRMRLLPALLAMLLVSACGTPAVRSSADCPKPPPPPVARQPEPSQDYLTSAVQDIDRWQQQLEATLPTSSNASKPGPGESHDRPSH